LEEKLCAAFTSLGFEVTHLAAKVSRTVLRKQFYRLPRMANLDHYAVSLDAKSKVQDKGTVAAGTVKVATIIQHRDDYECHTL